jgi:hypothetical protein
MQYHFLQQVIEDKLIKLAYTPIGEQVSNILTKGLPPTSHSKFREAIGVCYPY